MLEVKDEDLSYYLEWIKTNLNKVGGYEERQLNKTLYNFIRKCWFRSYYCNTNPDQNLYLMLDQKWKNERNEIGKHYESWFRKNNLDWNQGLMETDRDEMEMLVW